MRKIALIILGIAVCLFCFWFFYLRRARENRLEKQGYEIVEKIEKYRNETGRLPKSLEDIEIKTIEGADAFDYTVYNDSVNYSISFIISIDNSRTYYSDSKKWEDFYRELVK